MFHVLIDTCVWLDLAQDPKLTPLLSVVEQLLKDQSFHLMAPPVVRDEFKRNKERVATATTRGFSEHFQQVR